MEAEYFISKLNEKGITDRQISDAIDLDYTTVYKIKNKSIKDPAYSTVKKLESLFRMVYLSPGIKKGGGDNV
ncbi:MAG: hypothetical protein ACKOAD_00265 [Gammaproteobacteria bacterium]